MTIQLKSDIMIKLSNESVDTRTKRKLVWTQGKEVDGSGKKVPEKVLTNLFGSDIIGRLTQESGSRGITEKKI